MNKRVLLVGAIAFACNMLSYVVGVGVGKRIQKIDDRLTISKLKFINSYQNLIIDCQNIILKEKSTKEETES